MVQDTTDRFDHAFGIGEHFIAPEADDPIALPFEPSRSHPIISLLQSMLAAIDLDDKARSGSQEIDDVGSDSDLAPEFHAVDLAVAQPVPEPALGIR